MGCDIHLHTEIKIDGVWHHFGYPNVRRNYALFALMADVRNDEGKIQPIVKPKGLPSDISTVTALDAKRWKDDAHSHSWLSAEELALLEDRWNAMVDAKHGRDKRWDYDLEMQYVGYLFSSSWASFHKYPNDWKRLPELQDVRWVFWFDN